MKRRVCIFLCFLMAAIAIVSCEDMEDIHADFIKNGEIVYASVPDTVQTLPGNNRIQLKWLVHRGNNVTKSVVEWEDGGALQSQSMDVALDTPLDSVLMTVDNLEEKSYLFYAYNVDRDGNRSVKKQVTGSVYGPIYELSLTNRPILKVEGGLTVDSVIVSWGNPAKGYTGTEIVYNNRAGEQVSIMMVAGEDRVVIKDWESEGEMSYRSFYIPQLNAIDTFSSPYASEILPRYVEFTSQKIDKTNWAIVDFSSQDEMEGLAVNVIDNDLGTFWHSQWSGAQPGYPHHFTIDMNAVVQIDKVECFRRQGNNNGQTKFKIYTSNDGVNFDDQGTFDFDSKSDAGQIYFLTSLPEARYLKYEAIEGPNFYAFLAEIYIYGQPM
jgi:hypothetical protein